MRRFRFLPLLTCVALLSASVACVSYEVTVDSHLINCTGVGPMTCMMLSDTPESDQRVHYEGIVGFDYAWCSTHTLLVHDEARPFIADGSARAIVLDSIVASDAIDGETFALTLLPGWQLEAGRGLVPYHCAEGEDALCGSINDALGEEIVDGEFNNASVEAQFVCEDGNPSPRLLSFEAIADDDTP